MNKNSLFSSPLPLEEVKAILFQILPKEIASEIIKVLPMSPDSTTIILVVIEDIRERARIAKSLEFSHSVQHVLGAYAVGWWSFERIEERNGERIVLDASGYGNQDMETTVLFMETLS